MEIQRLNGIERPVPLPPPSAWRLHLKTTTPLDIERVKGLPTAGSATQLFLDKAWRYMDPAHFDGLHTSRVVRPTLLSNTDVAEAVAMGKFEPVDPLQVHGPALPSGVHGVNVFAVPELKGRRRLITEPHLNGVISKRELPTVTHPTRLARRQSLRQARYMLQLDFEAYYDAIPLPESMRNKFVFRARDGSYFRLRTLPTGARWSVAVGQAVTWVIVDIDTPILIHTMIDNILLAAREGQERDFVRAARAILERIRLANLLTSPDRETLAGMSDEALLEMGRGSNVFLGEEYEWNGSERLVRNSVKTVAKLTLSLAATRFTHRTFASVVSLILFALHTTRLNPARAYQLLRAYRGVYRLVTRGRDWDEELEVLDPAVRSTMDRIGAQLIKNEWCTIAPERNPTYNDSDYDAVVCTDASAAGWGAIITRPGAADKTTTYQQRWVNDLDPAARRTAAWKGYVNFDDDFQFSSEGNARHFHPRYMGSIPKNQKFLSDPKNRKNHEISIFQNTGGGSIPENGNFSADPQNLDLAILRRPDASSNPENGTKFFNPHHSAHAEPRGAQLALWALLREGVADGARIALITDHEPIVIAQRKLNGYGGIVRGYALNRLYEYVHDIWHARGIEVTFFYLSGLLNPADSISRNFGEGPGDGDPRRAVRRPAPGMALPALASTTCPLCVETRRGTMGGRVAEPQTNIQKRPLLGGALCSTRFPQRAGSQGEPPARMSPGSRSSLPSPLPIQLCDIRVRVRV